MENESDLKIRVINFTTIKYVQTSQCPQIVQSLKYTTHKQKIKQNRVTQATIFASNMQITNHFFVSV